MQYMLAVFVDFDGPEDENYLGAWRAYHQAMVDAGVYRGGEGLDRPETATTVRLNGGKRTVQDGPFAESKEQLGGFMVLELPSLREAVDWAARCPAAAYGAIEIRPVLPDPLAER